MNIPDEIILKYFIKPIKIAKNSEKMIIELFFLELPIINTLKKYLRKFLL